MTSLSEAEFVDSVVTPYLVARFGEDAVNEQFYLEQTTAYADFWVDLDVVILAIEVENDAGSIRSGVGQALEYSQNDDRAVPVVITPVGQVEEAQADQLRDVCPIVELPVPAGNHETEA